LRAATATLGDRRAYRSIAHPFRDLAQQAGPYFKVEDLIPAAPQQMSDPVAAQQLGLQELENLRQQQASALAYSDCFCMVAVLTFAVAFLVLVMKRSVAAKGARLTGE
jgi:hypothetical protein